MPRSRQMEAAFLPALSSLRIATIWASLNRDLRMLAPSRPRPQSPHIPGGTAGESVTTAPAEEQRHLPDRHRRRISVPAAPAEGRPGTTTPPVQAAVLPGAAPNRLAAVRGHGRRGPKVR